MSALLDGTAYRKRRSPTIGRGLVLDPDVLAYYRRNPSQPINPRDAAVCTEWVPNALLDEGEFDLLSVWLLQTSDLSKYLCLLKGAAPAETDTLAFLAGATNGESNTPGTNGYNRLQILNTDWGALGLNVGDYQTIASGKTFGPAATTNWTATGAGLVTHLTSQSGAGGKFLLYLALSGATTVNVGQSFLYQLTAKAQ